MALQHPDIQTLDAHLVTVAATALLIAGTAAAFWLWRMAWSGIRIDKNAFKPVEGPFPIATQSIGHAIAAYFRTLAMHLLEGVVQFAGVVVLSAALLILFKIAWFSYIASPIGRLYPHYFPVRAHLIATVMAQDPFSFPLILTAIAFATGMVVSALCRFFYVTRYLYIYRGILGRVLLIAAPLNLAVAAVFRHTVLELPWGAAYAAVLFPTLLSFPFCFRFAQRVLPEIGWPFAWFKQRRQAPMHIIYLQRLNSSKKMLAFDPLTGRRTGMRIASQEGLGAQGVWLLRRGCELILYRYGRDLFLQIDGQELTLSVDMTVQRIEEGCLLRRFELHDQGTRRFQLGWARFWGFGLGAPAAMFIDTLERVLKDRETFDTVFLIEDDPEPDLAI